MDDEQRIATALASSGFGFTTYGYPSFEDGDGRVLQLKARIDSRRDLEAAIVQLARLADDKQVAQAVLVVLDMRMRTALAHTWATTLAVLKSTIAKKLKLLAISSQSVIAIPAEEEWLELGRALTAPDKGPGSSARFGAFYMVAHILLNNWLLRGGAMKVGDLGAAAGVSQPTVRFALKRLESHTERDSRRRVQLTSFPRQAWAEMTTLSARIRESVYFEDRSGRPRSPEQLLARLRKHAPDGAAIGGVVAARHWDPQLDLEGIPRLDLGLHAPDRTPSLEFVSRVDPALKRTDDPNASISLAVHRIRRAETLFAHSEQSLAWSDPVDTLLDLHELRLYTQADDMVGRLRATHE